MLTGCGYFFMGGRSFRDLYRSRGDVHFLKSRLKAVINERCYHRLSMHGALVQTAGVGTLITGESGTGKTTCAVDLTRRGHKWIADDIVVIEKKGRLLVGSGHPRTRRLLELDGKILDARDFLGAKAVHEDTAIDMVIELGGAPSAGPERVACGYRILGRPIPYWRLSATLTRRGTVAAVETLAERQGFGEGM